MYAWIIYLLPGPKWLRVILFLALVLAVLAALFTWVYPTVNEIPWVIDITGGDVAVQE